MNIRTTLPWILATALAAGLLYREVAHRLEEGQVEEQPLGPMLITRMEHMGKLELVRYQVQEAIEYKRSNTFMPDERVLLLLAGEAVGCVDLRKLRAQDVRPIGQDSLLVVLPAPELCYYKIDHQRSRTYNMSTLKLLDQSDLVEQAYRKGEQQLKAKVLKGDLLLQTRQSAQHTLRPLLEQLSGKTVVLQFEQEKMPLRKG